MFPSTATDPAEAKRRARGIIHKIKGRNLYQVSETGRTKETKN